MPWKLNPTGMSQAVLNKTHTTLYFPTTPTYCVTKLVVLISHSEAVNFKVPLYIYILHNIRRYKVLPEET